MLVVWPLVGNEGMENKLETTIGLRVKGNTMKTTIMGYIGATTRIRSFIPSYPKASF